MKQYFFYITIFTLLCFSCAKEQFIDFSQYTNTQIIDDNIFLRCISAKNVNNNLKIVYCDERTQALKYATLSANNVNINYVDKVDTENKNNSQMGTHSYVVSDGKEYLVYEEYKNEKDMYFKIINKKIEKNEWTVDLVSINCSNFISFDYDNAVFIMYPDNDHIIAKQYDQGLATVHWDDDSKNAFELNIIKSNVDNIFYLYYFDDNCLVEKTLQISKSNLYQITTTNSRIVAVNVAHYSVFIDNNNKPNIIYYNEDSRGLYLALAEQEVKLMGYFPEVYALNSIYVGGIPFYIISTIDSRDTTKISYELSLVYQQSETEYKEGLLLNTSVPISIMNSIYYDNKLQIIYGYNDLSITSVDIPQIFHE